MSTEMKHIVPILGLSILFQPMFIQNAHALRTAHRPWLAKSPGVAYKTPLETDRISLTPRHARSARHSTGSSAKGEKIVRQAIHYKGTKYRFGGDSKTHGF